MGKGLAKQFAKCGCKLICVDVNKSLNEETVQEINEMTGEPNSAESLVCDVGDWEDVKRLREEVYKRHDKIDILVNNAGIVYGKTILNESEDVIKKIINVNLASNYWVRIN